MIVYMFCCLDVHDPAQFTGNDPLFDLCIKGSITQDVADHHFAFCPLDSFCQTAQFFLIDGKGFFKKHIIACFQQGDGGVHMFLIHGAVDDGIGKFSL